MTTKTTITISATHSCRWLGSRDQGVDGYELHPELPQSWEARSADVATREEAGELLATMPKSFRAWVSYCRREDGVTVWSVGMRANLTASGVNGGVNETGIKRYASLRRWAEKAGVELAWRPPYCVNSYPTQEAFEEAIA